MKTLGRPRSLSKYLIDQIRHMGLGPDEQSLLFDRMVWWGSERELHSLIDLLCWYSDPTWLSWGVLRCLQEVDPSREIKHEHRIEMLVLASDRRILWRWGALRPTEIHHALALLGFVHRSRLEEWEGP